MNKNGFGYALSCFNMLKSIENEIENMVKFVIKQVESILTKNEQEKVFLVMSNDFEYILYTSLMKWGSIELSIKCMLAYAFIIYKKCDFENTLNMQFDHFIKLYEFRIVFTSFMTKLIKFETPLFSSNTTGEIIAFTLKNYEIKQYFDFGSEIYLTFNKTKCIQNYSLKFINALDQYIIENGLPEPSTQVIEYTKNYFKLKPKRLLPYLNTIVGSLLKSNSYVFFSNIYTNPIIKSEISTRNITSRQKKGSIQYQSHLLQKSKQEHDIKYIYNSCMTIIEKEKIIEQHYANLENTLIPNYLKCCIQETNVCLKKVKKIDYILCCGIIILNGEYLYSIYKDKLKMTLSEEYITLIT